MSEGECIGQCMAHVIFRCFLTAAVYVIEKHIVQRRDSVILRGRQLQDLLRLPECMRVFSETDPGMPDKDIRQGAEVLSICGFVSALGGLSALTKWTIWDPWVMVPGVAVPGSAFCLLWLGLALSKRHRLRSQTSTTGEGYHATRTLLNKEQAGQRAGEGGRDLELERSMRSVWADMWLIPMP